MAQGVVKRQNGFFGQGAYLFFCPLILHLVLPVANRNELPLKAQSVFYDAVNERLNHFHFTFGHFLEPNGHGI